jgi:DNA adenine methylase
VEAENEDGDEVVSPLLKWAGGKRHIAELLAGFLPTDWRSGKYLEPFMGSGAMFLHLQPGQAYLSDLNPRLVGFYRFVKDSPKALLGSINRLRGEFQSASSGKKSEVFYEMRSRFNESDPQEIESASLLYALNKLCFNGLYRENSRGLFNVPFGHKKRFPTINDRDFLAVSKVLSAAEITTSDFSVAAETAAPGDFVYFDPPYIPINVTSSFTAYSSAGFGIEHQRRLAELMQTLAVRGVRAMCSNSDSVLTREVYSSLHVDVIQAPRMVSASSDGRGLVNELVIRNYEL